MMIYLKTFPSQSAKLALETSTKGQDTSAKSADKQTKFNQEFIQSIV